MDLYAVFGNPVAHSKSPRIHAAFAAQTGEAMVYEALLAPLDDFAGSVAAFIAAGGRGANVTVPFKEAAWALCKSRSPAADLAGAVNTLVIGVDGHIHGDNTDGIGLVRDITTNAGWSLAGRRVLLLGAGGAARGVIGPLLTAGAAQVHVANRTSARAQALAVACQAGHRVSGGGLDELADLAAFDLIINATSASLQGEALSLPAACHHAGTAVYDMMYGVETPFLAWARVQGLGMRRDGLGMLVEQAAEAFWLWRRVRPQTASVLAMLAAELAL